MIEKLINLVEKGGVRGALRTLGRYAAAASAARLGPGRAERDEMEELLAELRAGAYERIVLRRGSFGWHTALFQRAQQLARAMARCGCLVLYEAAPPHDRVRGAERLDGGLWLVNLRSPALKHAIEAAAAESGRVRYLHIASPESRLSVREVRRYAASGWIVCYDYIDAIKAEISAAKRVPRATLALYRFCMAEKNCVVVASSRLLQCDAEKKHGGEVALVENGVDCAHFFAPGPCPEDPAFRALLRRGRPIVCYYGALAKWLDYEAMRKIAQSGRFSLLLIGEKYDGSYDRELADCDHICFLGSRPYAVLKDYAARCDVLLIPFKKGPVGDAASPVKLFEYFALQKPVVAGDTAECRRYESVVTASSAEAYLPCLERALALGRSEAYLAEERREALAADWKLRAETLCARLRRLEERKEGRFPG